MLYMIGIALTSWRFGVVRRTDRKAVYALGPLRFAWHRIQITHWE